MLSSIILSLAMNATPAPSADVIQLHIKEVGTRRGSIRLNNNFTIEEAGTRRGSIRLNNNFTIEEAGTRRGSIRL
jgi:hypothetical protein